jgi:IS6 family transposase
LVPGRDLRQGGRPLAPCHRAIDQFGQVIDVFVSPQRDAKAARRFVEQAITTTRSRPGGHHRQGGDLPDRARRVAPGGVASHRQDANHHIEADHGRLTSMLGPMRGLKQVRSAKVVLAGHGLVQDLRRGHDEPAVEEPVIRRVAVAFDELAVAT